MRASELLASEPCSPPVLRGARAYASPNCQYHPLNQGSLQPIPAGDIREFRRYISTIPWEFKNPLPTLGGRVIYRKADVRQFADSSIILPAWPVVLAMVPLLAHGESHRGYDIDLTNEQPLSKLSRPDEAITRAWMKCGQCKFTLIVLIELKGPRGLILP